MKKFGAAAIAVLMVVSLFFQGTAPVKAAPAKIKIYIDGVQLSTDQDPIMIGNRTMLPLRAIFEALDAKVFWNQKEQTVRATKDGTTISLKIGSKTATVNNQTVSLDVPAQNKKGRTMVPVRFVSEALGDEVEWNSAAQTVYIKTTNRQVTSVPYITPQIIGQSGDGRDVRITFGKVSNEAQVDHYRLFVVKAANASSFNLSKAENVSSSHSTTLLPNNNAQTVTLQAQSRDVDGELITTNRAYVVFVLTVAKGTANNVLSSASQSFSLTVQNTVQAISNLSLRDVSDYGDGRDLSVSFTKPQNESNIGNYRIFIVKTKDASSFNASAAGAVSSAYYTNVSKTAGTNGITLGSGARDTSGELIKNGISYTAFVLSVSNSQAAANRLSSASSAITLNNSPIATPSITKVEDVNDFGDGRDLLVSFNRVSDESKITGYRIFVVKSNNSNGFNLSWANSVSSSNYTQVNKTGSNINQVLPSGSRDTDGARIQNGVSYRVYVMAVGGGSYAGSNTLSSASSAITLSANTSVQAVSNLAVSDISDMGDGRDLLVTFNRPSDENNINHYRIMVVKAGNAGRFNLSDANALNSAYYTQVNKTGYNISQSLYSGARDVNGDVIKNGVDYRVFVLTVANGSNAANNKLSSASATIRLDSNLNVPAVGNVAVSDISDYGDGRDLLVTFNRVADENIIHSYRVFLVKTANAGSFNLQAANAVNSSNYTQVSKTGSNISQYLFSGTRDIHGELVRSEVSYQVFVLTVGNNAYSGKTALSAASAPIVLTNNSGAAAVSSVSAVVRGNTGDARDIEVSFPKASNENNIAEYRVMVVRADQGFALNDAVNVPPAAYTRVSKQNADIRFNLAEGTRDVRGDVLQKGVPYRVYVLSVADGRLTSIHALSPASTDVVLVDQSVPAASGVTAIREASGSVRVSFTKPQNDSGVANYAVLVVPAHVSSFSLADANAVSPSNYKTIDKQGEASLVFTTTDRDTTGVDISPNVAYRVYVLTIANGVNASVNALSPASEVVVFTLDAPPADVI